MEDVGIRPVSRNPALVHQGLYQIISLCNVYQATKPPIHLFTPPSNVNSSLQPSHDLSLWNTHTFLLCSFPPHSLHLSVRPSTIYPFIQPFTIHPSIHSSTWPSTHSSITHVCTHSSLLSQTTHLSVYSSFHRPI